MARAAAVMAAVLIAQNPLPAPPPDTRPAVIVGTAVDATSGRAVRRALVRLEGPGTSITRAADDRGRFFFANLAPGVYGITAVHDGYFDGAYGRVRAGGDSLALPLQPGEWRTGVEVRLFRPAVIGGSVDDEALEALAGIRVQPFRREWIDGRETWTPGASVETDDKGDYRLYDLMPGEYVVSLPSVQVTLPIATMEEVAQSGSTSRDVMAVLFMNGGPGPLAGSLSRLMNGMLVDPDDRNLQVLGATATPPMAASGPRLAYRTIFHPAADAPASAVPIRIGPGERRTGVSFRLDTVSAVRVSGRVEGPDGPVPGLLLRMLRDDAIDFGMGAEAAVTLTAPDGSFTFLHVPAGRYVISARSAATALPNWQPGSVAAPRPATPARPLSGPDVLWGEQLVAVFDEDVHDVVVIASRGATLSGRVVLGALEGEQAAGLAPGVELVLEASRGSATPPPVAAASDGNFTIAGVPPGQYRLRTAAQPPGWFLASAVVRGVNALTSDFSVEAGEEILDIAVTLTDRPAGVTGSVYDGRGLPVPGARAIVAPAGPGRGIDRNLPARLVRSVRADVYGTYSLIGLLPGTYDLVAVTEEADVRWQDPAVLARIGSQAVRVAVQPGQAVQQALRVSR